MPEMLGYTADDLLGRTIFDFIFEEDFAVTKQKIEQRKHGKAETTELRLRRKDGSEIIFLHKSSPTRNKAGEITGFLTMNTDITERKKAEDSISFQAHLLDVVEQSVIATGLNGIVTYWNQFAQELYGWTAAEAIGRNVSELVTPEINQVQAAEILAQLNTGKSWSGEFIVRDKNGTTFPAYVSNSPIYDDKETIIGVVGVSTDISERIDSEKTLRESEARFRLLCEAAPLGVFLTDAVGGYLLTNPYLQEVAGFSFDEALVDGFANFIHPEDRERIFREWKEATAAGKECFQQYRFLHRDGAIRWVSVRTAPIIAANNQIVSHVGTVEDITARRLAEESLRQAEAKYRSLVESSPAIVYLAEPVPPFAPIYVSPNITRFGYTAEEWFNRADMWFSLIHPEDRARVLNTTEAAMNQSLDTDLEYRITARDGAIHWLHDKGRFVTDDQGKRIGWQGVILDVTETKQLEEQLRQSQKLESVGRLAGGIAHDFNNMLTAINGYSELTLRSLEDDNPLRQNIEEIKKAGERSALLTHQLLAFSRQQVLQPLVLDLNEIIADTTNLLERLIGEDVELITALNPKTGRVNVDPGQLSQIIMNLAVNARDAMPHGGKLTIETANIFLKPDDARQKIGILPGAYVLLAVCDTGQGIDGKIQQQIFEPFFTTKELGKGTGLGLSTVYGIVKQSGGNIEVDTKVGAGTTFRIYLPRVAEQPEAAEITDAATKFLTGTETILLVEDEELVRKLSKQMLETCGYTVVEARDGLEALKICDDGTCEFDLLMTDVVMPQMGGRELAEKLTERLPNIKILFTSGYTDDAVIRHGVVKANTNFVQKPFTFDELNRKVRKLLDAEDL